MKTPLPQGILAYEVSSPRIARIVQISNPTLTDGGVERNSKSHQQSKFPGYTNGWASGGRHLEFRRDAPPKDPPQSTSDATNVGWMILIMTFLGQPADYGCHLMR
ncbi:MAG: hypothetical protein WCL11_23085 [Verrucomicrobiota bacterium]